MNNGHADAILLDTRGIAMVFSADFDLVVII